MQQKQRLTYYDGQYLDGLKYSSYKVWRQNASYPITAGAIADMFAFGLSETRYHTLTLQALTGSNYVGSEYLKSTTHGKPKYNNCEHTVDFVTNKPYSYLSTSYIGSPQTLWTAFTRTGHPTAYYPWLDFGSTRSLSEASSRAWFEMQPRFEGEISLLNFIFELKDFRDIAKVFLTHKGINSLKNFGKRIKRFPDPSKSAASLWLFKQFAYDPLVQDLGVIISQMQTLVMDAQEQFGNLGLVTQKRHYTEPINEEVISILGPVSSGIPRQLLVSRRDIFTATMEYQYDFLPYDAYNAFMRWWGLKLTPEAIWNGLPFSFIADYFCSIGKSLHRMELDAHVNLNVHQYCESLLTTVDQGMHLVGNSLTRGYAIDGIGHPGFIQHPVFLAGRRSSRYKRRVCRPVKGFAPPRPRNPNDKQFYNMLALARCFIG